MGISGYCLLPVLIIVSRLQYVRSQENACSTLRTQVNIVKRLTVERNGSPITVDCVASVVMNKCEGTCTSHVSPSVVQYPGFRKVIQPA